MPIRVSSRRYSLSLVVDHVAPVVYGNNGKRQQKDDPSSRALQPWLQPKACHAGSRYRRSEESVLATVCPIKPIVPILANPLILEQSFCLRGLFADKHDYVAL